MTDIGPIQLLAVVADGVRQGRGWAGFRFWPATGRTFQTSEK